MKKQIVNRELLSLLPNEVKEMNLPPKANEIYCQFLSMADEDGWYYSTINGLAKTLNCSKTTIIANLKLLEIKNLIIERVAGKIGVASRFKIKLFNSTNCNNSTNENSTNCNNSTNNSTELKKFIEEVITLKINDLKNEILNELRCLFNINSTIKENKRKEENIKQINNNSYTNSSYNIQEVIDIDKKKDINKKNIEIDKKENIEIYLNKKENIDRSTCKYKRRKKNDYEFTLEEKDDFNPIVENTKVEGLVSKSDGNTSKTKKFFYSLKDSSLTFSSWEEAQKYSNKNNLNFDENFKKVEVSV